MSLIKSNAFWYWYCYIIAFLSIFATAIITISGDSNGVSMTEDLSGARLLFV